MQIASASYDKTARVWDAASGRERVRLVHRDGGRVSSVVTGVAFSPDGARIATASGDGTARVWEIASGRELTRLIHAAWVHAVALSADGARIATASYDKTARVWDIVSGRELAHLVHEDAVRDVAFSPGDERVGTASADGTTRVWEIASGRELVRLNHGRTVLARTVLAAHGNGVAFSPDGTLIATASDRDACVCDSASGRRLASFMVLDRRQEPQSAVFNTDGTRIAIASGHSSRPLLAGFERPWMRAEGGAAAVWSDE